MSKLRAAFRSAGKWSEQFYGAADVLIGTFLAVMCGFLCWLAFLAIQRGTTTVYEFSGFVGGMGGCVFTFWMWRDLLIDLYRLRGDGLNGADEMLNFTAQGINGFFLLIDVTIVASSLWRMFLPAAQTLVTTSKSGNISAGQIILTALFTIGGPLFMRYRRKRLRDFLRARYHSESVSGIAVSGRTEAAVDALRDTETHESRGMV